MYQDLQLLSLTDCLENLDFLTKNGGEAATRKLLHGLHYWLLIAIEERVVCGQIDRGYDAIGPSQVAALRQCAEFGLSLSRDGSRLSAEAVLDGLRFATRPFEGTVGDGISASAILFAVQSTTGSFGGQQTKHATNTRDTEGVSALRTKIALLDALMACVHCELLRLASVDAYAAQGMEIDAVATVLAVTDAAIGMLCAIRDASLEANDDDEALEHALKSYLTSDRMEEGGPEASRIMESAFASVLHVLTSATLAA